MTLQKEMSASKRVGHRVLTLTGLIKSESCIPLRSSSGWFCNLLGTLNGSSGSGDSAPIVCSSDMLQEGSSAAATAVRRNEDIMAVTIRMRERVHRHPSPVPRWQSAAAESQPSWQSMSRLTETTEFESTRSHNTSLMSMAPAAADEISTDNNLLFEGKYGYHTILSAAILVSMHRSEARLVQKDAYRPREPDINEIGRAHV